MAPYRTNNTSLFVYSGSSSSANIEWVAIRESGSKLYGASSVTVESLAAGASTTKTVSVVGANVNDVGVPGFSVALPAGVIMENPRITLDTASVRFTNVSTTTSAASSAGNLAVIVTKRGGTV